MKTKFLFSAAILSSMFAACTNDDLVQAPKADLDNSGRIMAGKVTLDFGSNPSTRMDYDSDTDKFTWDGTETIGALLMDDYNTTDRPFNNPEKWATLTWTEKYKLIDYIHTDYPFSWDAKANAWVSNAKMLEGNYFFAYPYEGYEGQRQLVHSLANQVQEGSTKEAMEAGAAKNQYWIGYSQIKAGVENKDVLASVKMARVLAPISFAIKVIGTEKYTIKKVTIQGKDLKTMITINPTKAVYTGMQGVKNYNLENGSGTAGIQFNYANFISNETDLYTNGTPTGTDLQNIVYNIDDATNYVWGDAMRAAVHAGANASADKEYAELYINNAPAIGTGDASVYGMVYVNIDPTVATKELTMSIYTDKGIVKEIGLTAVNTEIKEGVSTAITDKAVSVLTPTTRNFINIQIDDNSFDATDNLVVNNVDDLERFIGWNLSKNRTFTATLANNNTLTADMVTKLKAAQAIPATTGNLLKVVAATGQKLIIAADADADVLNYIDVSEVDVEILGKVTVDDAKTENLPATTKKIIVAEGAELTLSAVTKQQLDVENNGNIKVEGTAKAIKLTNNKKATVTVNGSLAFAATSVNNGKITVNGDLAGKSMMNNAEIDNYGKIWNVTNAAKAIVTTASEASDVNNFDVNPINATILLRAITDKVTFTVGSNAGIIKFVGGNVDMGKAITAEVTNLVVTSGYLRINNAVPSKLVDLTIDGGTLIEGGSYTGSTWNSSEVKLDFATNATVTMTGAANLKINNANLDDATVAIQKGNATLAGKVTFGKAVTLGSVTGYTKNGVSMGIESGATVAFTGINIDANATGATFIISNNGTATTANATSVAPAIVVKGNTITTKP